jgi:phage-related protein
MRKQKPLVWLHGEVKTPPLSAEARIESGYLLRKLQNNERLSLPNSRPMTSICPKCHELRINDKDKTWRIICRLDDDAVIILEVFEKKSQKMPKSIIDTCKKRIISYDSC